jgi:uncharacterized protein
MDNTVDRPLLYLDRLSESGEEIEGDLSPALLEIPKDVGLESMGSFHYRIDARIGGNELIVHGEVWGDVRYLCSRCGEVFPAEVREGRFEVFREVVNPHESVDLTPDMREAIVLAFQNYPLCRKDCRGRCPQCGENLNKKPCSCRPPGDRQWTMLDDLKLG